MDRHDASIPFLILLLLATSDVAEAASHPSSNSAVHCLGIYYMALARYPTTNI